MGRMYAKNCNATSQAVLDCAGALCGVLMTPTASTDTHVVCYDNATEANGEVVFDAKVNDAETSVLFGFEHTPISLDEGLYVEIDGADTITVVYVNQHVENED